MRFFEDSENAKETLVLMSNDDAKIIVEALEYYVANNKRKIKASNLLKRMAKLWSIF